MQSGNRSEKRKNELNLAMPKFSVQAEDSISLIYEHADFVVIAAIKGETVSIDISTQMRLHSTLFHSSRVTEIRTRRESRIN